jgi:hypothetical protein
LVTPPLAFQISFPHVGEPTTIHVGVYLLEIEMPSVTVTSHVEQLPIHSLVEVMTQFILEVAIPSHAKVPMEPVSNIPTLPSTTILHPPLLEVPIPTLTKVSIDPPPFEVPISSFVHVLTTPIDKVSTPPFVEAPLISTNMDVCREVKESSKTVVPKSFKSIKQLKKDDKLQELYVSLW